MSLPAFFPSNLSAVCYKECKRQVEGAPDNLSWFRIEREEVEILKVREFIFFFLIPYCDGDTEKRLRTQTHTHTRAHTHTHTGVHTYAAQNTACDSHLESADGDVSKRPGKSPPLRPKG